MKFKILVIFSCVILFSVSFATVAHLLPSRLTSIRNTGTTDWWPMYHHDPMHTGYSTSAAPNTNEILWTHRLADWVRSSPAVYDGLVYIGSDDNKIYALNATTGQEVWNYTTNGDIVSSPTVTQNRVYIGSTDNNLYCLDAGTGDLVWTYTTGGDIQSSPCVTEGKVLFGSDDCKIYALDAIVGSHLWNFSTGDYVWSSPTVSSNRVFVGSADRNLYALDLYSGSLIWNYTTITSILTSPAVMDGRVFIASSSKVYCLNETDGDLIWSYTTGGSIYSSPAIFGSNIFIGSDDHKMYCFNATDGHQQWNFTTGKPIHSSPAIADGKVFFGSDDREVYCLDVDTGQCVWHYFTGGRIMYSSPAVAIETVFIGSSYSPDPYEGKIYAFHTTNEPPVAFNLSVKPSLPLTTNDLIGSYDYYDPDGDPENGTQIIWYKDGVPQAKLINVLIVPSSFTIKGQTWYFIVKPKDGKLFGDLQTSPSVTIQNSPPTIDSYYPLINPTIDEGESQEFNITKSDVDFDLLTVVWHLNGTMLLENSDSYIHTAESGSAGTYNISVTVSDTISQTRHEWTLTVLAVKHDVAVTNVTCSKTIVGQGHFISINVTIENQGDIIEIFNVTAYANTTAIQTMETTLANENSATVTFLWNTTGVAKGNYTISAYTEPVVGETDITDNTYIDGWVIVAMIGDITGPDGYPDGTCNIRDVSLVAKGYGANLVTDPASPKYGEYWHSLPCNMCPHSPNCDLTGPTPGLPDGKINIRDIATVASHYGENDP